MKNASHLFVFAPGVLHATSEDEVEATAHALEEFGLFQMPYDRDVYIEVHGWDATGPSPEIDPNHNIIYGPFGVGQSVGMTIRDIKSGKILLDPPDPYNHPDAISSLKEILIVLLATKNADKATSGNKLAKLGIGKSGSKRFDYTTTISLPRSMPDDPDNPAKGGTKAPHLRRGHIRRQHYGAGRQSEKRIWIAPIFVNADPDFVATRRRYRIGSLAPKTNSAESVNA